MNRKILLLCLFISVILAYPISVHSEANSEIQELFGDQEEIEVIVVLKDDYDVLGKYGVSKYKDDFEKKKMMIQEQQENVLEDLEIKDKNEGVSVQSDEEYDFDLTNTYTTVNGFAGKLKKSSYEKLKNDQRVESILKPKKIKSFLSDSAGVINATRAWSLIYNSANITGKAQSVCVIDTGVDYTHPSLGNCSSSSFTSGTCPKVISGYDFVNSDNNPMDDNGHGTHVAGIIASTNDSIRGVAPDATIIAIKILNSAGSGNTSNLINGIDWCVNNASIFNITVISMSLGVDGYKNTTYCDSSDNPLLVNSIHNAINRSISVIAAAGNDDNSPLGVSSPACISNVTVVGSTTKSDSISSFSDIWSLPMLLAPGSSIKSLKPSFGCLSGCSCTDIFMTCSGTSMAAPHVAGAFALLAQYKKLEQNINLTPFQIQDALNDTGKQISDSGSGLIFSRINIFSAILSLDKTAPNITFVAPTPSNNTNISLNSTGFYINTSNTEVLSSAIFEISNGSKTNISMAINGLNSFINLTSLKVGVISFRVYGNDSAGNSNITDLIILQINNTAPNISRFAPSNESVNIIEPNNQTFSINFTDSENDTIIFYWYLNNSLQTSGINKSEFNFTGNFTSNGFYIVTANITDGSAYSPRSWNMTVSNTNRIPNIISVNLTNTDFLNRTNGTLLAFWSFNDSDGDAITANETIWYINNTKIENYTNKTSINPINTTRLENWTFSVRVFDGNNWSVFMNSSTIKILNSQPSLGINTTTITLSETQQVNITLSSSDLDNDNLNYTINDSRFFKQNNYFIWNTNLSDAGAYKINVTVNDSLDIDSLTINITINDASDIDNDGNPDFNDTDSDNDGLNDNTDYLIGNTSLINTTIQNLSIIIGNSSNLSQIFNQSFTINFTIGNLTILSFDFNFSNGADNVSKTLMEQQSQFFLVNGKNYLVTPGFIDATRAKLTVNAEATGFLGSGDSYTLLDGATLGVTGITYQDFAGGIHSVDIYVASTSSNTLDLSKLTVNRTTNGSSAIAIRGLRLSNSTKTAFLEKINTTAKSVCIKDADAGFDSITSACNGANETLVTCNNSTSGQYACFDTGTRYRITGLNHSAVKEQCRDVDGDGYGDGCSLGTDSCDTNSGQHTSDGCNPPSSGGSSGGGSGGGGGGGGGGAGIGFVCNMDWNCGEWSECVNGFQARSCNFVKVPQHVQSTQCPLESDAPKTTQSCEAKKETPATALATDSDNVNEQNTINQEQNLTAAQDSEKDKTGLAAITGALTRITKRLNFWLAGIAALVIAISAILFYKFRNNHNK